MPFPKSEATRLWTKTIPDFAAADGTASQLLCEVRWLIVATIAARAHVEKFILCERGRGSRNDFVGIAISLSAARGRYVESAAAHHELITGKYESRVEMHFDIFQQSEIFIQRLSLRSDPVEF